MIHSASPQSRPAVNFALFRSFVTDVRTEGWQADGQPWVKIVITTGRNVAGLVYQKEYAYNTHKKVA